jgi:hypothetical protein
MTAAQRVTFQPMILLGLIVLLAGSGCQTGANVFIAKDAPSGESLHRLVVLPMNFEYEMPPNFEQGAKLLATELVGFLTDTGHEVEVVPFSEALHNWANVAANEKTASVGGYEIARAELARRTVTEHPADAVVVPTLMIRPGQYAGRVMRWDGTRQPIKILRDNMNTRTMTDVVTSLSGTGKATSIRITIYDASATKIFEAYAGLEPIIYIRETEHNFYIRQRNDLFNDQQILKDGIRRSLAPLIAPQPPPQEPQ